ncbi:hypothetical protein H6A05_01805 [Megasphaera elsdenii]|uniref:hypothetical protein n=1 Tax=Megasphaera elsdenii TaxID=907 RepID=UPI00195EAA5C|nr:hypothetical protein [Megasphaera elsdenii]MBM6701063.1 hypothetical protein [Megasphaera elsdenii]
MIISYADGFLGQTMKNGTNGCAEAVGLMGAGNSQFLANEYNNGQYSVPGMVSDAQKAGIPVIPYQAGAANPNDVIVYGDNDHVVLSDGNGGYYGNSSSQNQIVHGSDATQMGGLQPTAIIKTGGQGGSFNFQAKDANRNPFINLAAKIRTSNPNEPFDQQSLMDILSQPTRSYAHEKRIHYLTDRDYQGDLLFLNPDVARWMKDSAKQLNDNRDADLKEQIDQANQQTRLKQAMQLAQLINRSGSVDNRRGYAAMAKMFGINLPTNDDQFVNSSDLLKTQVQLNNAERNYNFQQQQAKQAQDNWKKEFDLKKAISDRQAQIEEQKLALAMAKSAARGSGSGKGPHYSIGDIAKIKETLSAPFQQVLQAASDGSMSGDEIREALKNAEYENINTLSLLEPDGGPGSAYGQEVEDNTINKLKDWYGDDMSDQDHTWTNNPITRWLGWWKHDA